MSSNVLNQVPFLRTSRNYPQDPQALSVEISKTYVDLANFVNARTIGIFTTNRPIITGESWFISKNQRQQSLRETYTFIGTANIPHGLVYAQIERFVRIFGTYTDGTNTYGLIAGSNTAIAGQVSVYITPTNIVFAVGAGAPTVTSGIVTLEWLSRH